MEDGSRLIEDEDLNEEELVGGKLLIIARSFPKYKEFLEEGTLMFLFWNKDQKTSLLKITQPYRLVEMSLFKVELHAVKNFLQVKLVLTILVFVS